MVRELIMEVVNHYDNTMRANSNAGGQRGGRKRMISQSKMSEWLCGLTSSRVADSRIQQILRTGLPYRIARISKPKKYWNS